MERTITVKGTGSVSVKPDLTVITLSLESVRKDYDTAMEQAAQKLEALQEALAAVGFAGTDIKTTGFNVRTEYESERDMNGNYRSVFKGYCCRHDLSLSFDFDTALLSKVLSAVASCLSEPELNIRFSVKDPAAVNEALLEDAARNARQKAGILAAASGVELGELLSIDYSWGELNLYSDTDCNIPLLPMMAKEYSVDMDVEPDDIRLRDTATFVWRIA